MGSTNRIRRRPQNSWWNNARHRSLRSTDAARWLCDSHRRECSHKIKPPELREDVSAVSPQAQTGHYDTRDDHQKERRHEPPYELISSWNTWNTTTTAPQRYHQRPTRCCLVRHFRTRDHHTSSGYGLPHVYGHHFQSLAQPATCFYSRTL
jgi:hypothetical protein